MPDDPTAADRAYQAALQEIERVRAAGGTTLRFDRKEFRALDRIPDNLRSLPGLTDLDLTQTAVADLSPLHGLTGLRTLWLRLRTH